LEMLRQIFLLVSKRPFSWHTKHSNYCHATSGASLPGGTVRSMMDGGLKGYSGGKLIRPWYTPPGGIQGGHARRERRIRLISIRTLELAVWWAIHGEVPLKDVVLPRER
jgi:hypothetical protein